MLTEQRKYYRRTITEETPTAFLICDHQKIPCQLVEVSLGGFAVLASDELKVTPALARLQTQGLEYVVRIARQESLDDCYLLGLQQVDEVVPKSILLPASPLSQKLTLAMWGVALSILGVACYHLTNCHSSSIVSLTGR